MEQPKPDLITIDLDCAHFLEKELTRYSDHQWAMPCDVLVKIPSITPHSALTHLVRRLPDFLSIGTLFIEVGEGQKIDIKVERELLKAIFDAPFKIHWQIYGVEINPLIINQLYYLSEHGDITIYQDYSYEVAHAIRQHNIPWQITFNDQTIEAHEILDRQNLSESTLCPPTVVRQGRIKRAVQWIVRQVSRLRPKRNSQD